MAVKKEHFTRQWVCMVVRSGYHNGAYCSPADPHGSDWGCCYRNEISWTDEQIKRVFGSSAQDSEDWTEEDRFADFRDAYDYARSHFTLAAHAHAKVDRREAYWIWKTIQHGFEQQERTDEREQVSE